MNNDQELEQIEDLFEGVEIKDEETAQNYMKFMQNKLDELTLQNQNLAQQEAKRYEDLLNTMSRKIRRKYLKEKFSSKFKNNMNQIKQKQICKLKMKRN